MRLKLITLAIALLALAAPVGAFLGLHLDLGTARKCVPQIPFLSLSSATWSFGNISTNATRKRLFAVTNTGNGYISGVTVTGHGNAAFSVYTSDCAGKRLLKGNYCKFGVKFAPTIAGFGNYSAHVDSDQFDRISINVSGTGTMSDPTLTDNFDGANARPYTRNNWVTATGGGVVETVSNQFLGYTAPGTAYKSDWVGGDNQCSTVTIAADGSQAGPAVRMSTSAQTYYYVRTGSASVCGIYKVINGTETLLGTGSSSANVGDTVKLCVSGTTLTAYKNGSAVNTRTGQTDITTGYPGIRAAGGFAKYDNWVGALP